MEKNAYREETQHEHHPKDGFDCGRSPHPHGGGDDREGTEEGENRYEEAVIDMS
jgi:hypothetical protein